MLTNPSPSDWRKRPRKPRDPKPRFKADLEKQLDGIEGCPELQVPEGHLARAVLSFVRLLGAEQLAESYSALGRRGYRPDRLLAILVYGSLIGLHHSTKLGRACQTDAALRWLAGGWRPSATTLRRFRQQQAAFFEVALARTVALAAERGLLDLEDLAVDSVRLRAHASTHEVRTETRSTKRLAELEANVPDVTDAEAVALHASKVRKHRDALARLTEEERTNVVLTNPSAGLMKFPSGASAPGHRVTVVASGVSQRIAIGLLIDASGSDNGKLGPAIANALTTLDELGIAKGKRIVVAADAGYFTERDLAWADAHRDRVDVLIHEAAKSQGGRTTMDRTHFLVPADGSAPTCPAGTLMAGPYDRPSGDRDWRGVGCVDCPLRSSCTTAKHRTITIRPEFERLRDSMRARMAEPGAKERYGRRIATVEPVFGHVQDAMGFRRVSTRHAVGVRAEIFLKFLAHNIARLIEGDRLRLVYLLDEPEFWSTL
ncbi:MAG: IS1182 family transposase [Polyangiaceae bacterium]|nr:IS1182 family transposase [Polyangiaceae bacterium]